MSPLGSQQPHPPPLPFFLFFDNLGTSLDLNHLLWALPESSTVLSKAAILNGKTCATLKNLVHLLVL